MKKIIGFFQEPLFLKILLFLIVGLRLFLFTFPSFKIDMGDWQAWASRINQTGPLDFYLPGMLADYLPFFYLLLFIFTKIFVFIFNSQAIFSQAFDLYIRLISNSFDFLTAYLIYKILKNHNSKWGFLAGLLYLVNPAVIFNSSVWGQTDSIPTFFFISAIYFLNERKKAAAWSIGSALSLLVKPLNVAAMPVTGVRLLKNFSLREIILAAIFAVLIFFLVTVPFFIKDPLFGIFGHLLNSLSVYPYTSLNAYNFWSLAVGWWKPDSGLFWGISYHFLGYIIFFLILGITLIPYVKIKGRFELDYFAAAVSTFAFFLFLTRIHERHLFPLFSLLIISAFLFRSKFLLFSYVAVSVINFFDLFYSYYYYNFVYQNPLSANNFLFLISLNFANLFALVLLFLFAFIFILYMRTAFLKPEK